MPIGRGRRRGCNGDHIDVFFDDHHHHHHHHHHPGLLGSLAHALGSGVRHYSNHCHQPTTVVIREQPTRPRFYRPRQTNVTYNIYQSGQQMPAPPNTQWGGPASAAAAGATYSAAPSQGYYRAPPPNTYGGSMPAPGYGTPVGGTARAPPQRYPNSQPPVGPRFPAEPPNVPQPGPQRGQAPSGMVAALAPRDPKRADLPPGALGSQQANHGVAGIPSPGNTNNQFAYDEPPPSYTPSAEYWRPPPAYPGSGSSPDYSYPGPLPPKQ